MAKVVSLSLTSEQQLSFQYCGPAAIRMMLSSAGVIETQQNLWTAVMANSAGGSTAPPAGLLFPKQVCHQCMAWYCWYTTPEAMAKTITQRWPSGNGAGASYPSTGDNAVERLIDSLERSVPFPPAATTRASNHWVVVNGVHMDDPSYPGAPPVAIGNRQVNGMYYLDPFDGPVPLVRFASTTSFRGMLKSLDCGPRTNDYPIVVGRKIWVITRFLYYVARTLIRWPWPPWIVKRGPGPLPPF